MADVETTDAAVSNGQLDADSLEFAVNTNLSVMADCASPKGASPSLQELIEAELNARLCQPDSLEPTSSPNHSSLLSCDSIEPETHTLTPSQILTKDPIPVTTTGFTLNSLIDLDSLQSSTEMVDTESGIDLLSPTKFDELSNVTMDSLELSSDQHASSHSSLEQTTTTTITTTTAINEFNVTQKDIFTIPHKTPPSAEGDNQEDDSDPVRLRDLQGASSHLRISESNLTIASETRSEFSQVSQEVTRSSTPDSLASFESSSVLQESTTPQDNDITQGNVEDSVTMEYILQQKSVALSNIDSSENNKHIEEGVNAESNESLEQSLDIQQSEHSFPTQDKKDNKISQESVDMFGNTTQQEIAIIQGNTILMQIPLDQDTDEKPNNEILTSETILVSSQNVTSNEAQATSILTSDDPATPGTLSIPQCKDSPSPSPEGALVLNGTNPVCSGDSPNSARDDCGAVCSGRVESTTTTSVCGSGGGGDGVGVCDPVPVLQNGSNMEPQEEVEEDFWANKNDDDDFWAKKEVQQYGVIENEENGVNEEKVDDVEEEVEEKEGDDVIGSDDDDMMTSKGAKGLRFKKRTTTTTTTTKTENGVGGVGKKKEVVEEVEKKTKVEEVAEKKVEVTTEKKRTEIREKKGEEKKEMKDDRIKKEVKEEASKEEEEKENGVAEEGTEKKKKKKHRDREDGERRKKKKKRESEKENKKAAYQKRDDILEKHVGPRVRSFDASKMKSKFEKPKQVSQVSSECRQCGKQVFQMEKIVAEKAAWHKNCFRCKECNCILNLETYQSHEGVLYCKPHFKELFRPKVVVEDPDEARKERLLRKPKLIVLESQPQELAEGIVRSTNKPDYGLEDLSHANLKQKFKMFEQISTEEERAPETIPVRRSQSLLNKAARFLHSDEEYGVENSELGEYDEEEDEEDYEDEEGEEGEEGDKLNKKNRAASFSGMKDLKAGFARKNRQDELTKKRRQELAKFRQMLCAGKNISTREIFEGGSEEEKQRQRKEQIKIEGQIDAKNLRERFEKGMSIIEDDSEESSDRKEVDRVFKDAETASKARNLFKQIDKTVSEGGEVVMRPQSSANARRENRLSRDGKRIRNFTSQIFEDEDSNEEDEEKSSLADRFKFFATYEERAKEAGKNRKKLFCHSSSSDGEDQGVDVEELELGRDPNLVKCTDNYEDAVDCRGTRKILAKFKKMERQAEDIDREGENYDSEEEYSDEYSDEDEDSEEGSEEEEDSEEDGKPKYKDEVLEMLSAKKAASLRAKFEKWESEVERNNEYNQSIERYEDEDECMPSIDTARNLRAMFENKAQESSQPVNERPKVKVNRFV